MPMKLTKSHLQYMNIGRRYWGATREGMTDHQRSCLQSYLDKLEGAISRGIGLFLWGTNNVGKSYISALLCKVVWGQYRVTSYCVTSAALKLCWVEDTPAHPDSSELMRDRVREARFLVIDDLGKEYRSGSEFAEAQLGFLLRERVRNNLVTCFTSNLMPTEFSEEYGVSTGQLVKECMVPIRLKGDDMREIMANEMREFLNG